jgi:hypothetical protein
VSEAVRQLRTELTAAMIEGQDSSLRFHVGSVRMEFLMDVHRDRRAEAGVRQGVVSFGGKGAVAPGRVHQIKLVLNPTDDNGNPAPIPAEE